MKTPSRKKIEVLYYGILRQYCSTTIVAVTSEKGTRWKRHWYGRIVRPGVEVADCAASHGADTFYARFATREDAEANFKACARIMYDASEAKQAAYKVYEEAQKSRAGQSAGSARSALDVQTRLLIYRPGAATVVPGSFLEGRRCRPLKAF